MINSQAWYRHRTQDNLLLVGYLAIWLTFSLIPKLNYQSIWLATCFSILLIVYLAIWLQQNNWSWHRLTAITAKQVLVAILLGLTIIIIEILVDFSAMTSKHTESTNTALILKSIGKQPLFIIYTVVIAPALEELVFRKSLNNCICTIFDQFHFPQVLTLIMSGIIATYVFASIHADNHLAFYLLFGAFLQVLYDRVGNIRFTMIIHAIYNLTSLFLLMA